MPGGDANGAALVVAVAVEVVKGADLVGDGDADVVGHAHVEGGAQQRRRSKDGGAARRLVDGEADGAQAVQALRVEVVPADQTRAAAEGCERMYMLVAVSPLSTTLLCLSLVLTPAS